MIYLDNNATTPLEPAARQEMLAYLEAEFANPSSNYLFARGAKRAVATARERLASLLGAEPEEIIFTSGGTESDNAALFSATEVFPERKHLITCATEHDAVLNYVDWLVQRRGYEVTVLPVDSDGRWSVDALRAAIRPGDTAIISLMWGNNETGVLNDIPAAAHLAEEHGILFHTDAVQLGGKMHINLKEVPIHYLSLSGHKFHAPKGVGVLYVRQAVRYQPWMLGGGQEGKRRAGTENVASIVALGAAAAAASAHLEAYEPAADPILALRALFEAELLQRVPNAIINGLGADRTPNTTNVRLPGCDASGMIILLDQQKICVSAGSACHSGRLHPSHVLAAMGRSAEEARECLRVSFSRFNTPAEASAAVAAIAAAREKLLATLGSVGL